MYQVGQFKDSLTGILSGIDLDQTIDTNGAIERAAREMIRRADIPESMGRHPLTLYAGVYDYVSPTNVFGESIYDLAPQGNTRNFTDFVYRMNPQKFDRNKKLATNGVDVAFTYNKGIQILRVAQTRTTPRIILDPQNEADWTAGGSASTPVLDSTVFYDGNGSLRFNLTGASTGTLTKTIDTQDLTDYEGVGVVFLAIYAPSVTNLTNISVKIGSSASAYFSVTETDGFLGAWTSENWLLVAFDLAGATETGTVDIENVDYAQISIVHAGTISNFRVGGLWISLPYPYELLYETSAIFLTSAGVLSKTITTESDQIILGDDAYTMFQKQAALTILSASAGGMTSALYAQIYAELHGPQGYYTLFKADNPSQQQPIVDNWYDDEPERGDNSSW